MNNLVNFLYSSRVGLTLLRNLLWYKNINSYNHLISVRMTQKLLIYFI